MICALENRPRHRTVTTVGGGSRITLYGIKLKRISLISIKVLDDAETTVASAAAVWLVRREANLASPERGARRSIISSQLFRANRAQIIEGEMLKPFHR